jgi:oligopeptide transport system permease protein
MNAQTTTTAPAIVGRSLWQDAWRRLLKNRLAVISSIILIFIGIITILGPQLLPYGEAQIDLKVTNQPPSLSHWFGTDQLGRDLLIRSLTGGRISLMVAMVATAVSFIIGVFYGVISGYLGGYIDELMMRIVDIIDSLPYLFLVIILLALFPNSLLLLFIALGAVSWLTMARIVRGQVLSLKNQEFIEAAQSIGVPTNKIITRHLLPNVLGPIIIYTTLTVPTAMLSEAFLSFLGLGVQPPAASWGTLVSEGINSISIYPWQLIFPGLMMTITLFSLNFIGDGLRDALDPQMRKN